MAVLIGQPRRRAIRLAGNIKVNGDPVGSDFLASYIQERLFKSYLGTGKMHDGIKLVKLSDNVPDIVAEVVINEIKEGQRKALVQVSLLRYNKLFDNLDSNGDNFYRYKLQV